MKKLFLAIIIVITPIIIWLGLDLYKKRTAHKQYMSAVSLFAEKKDLNKALELIDQAINLNPKENYSYLYKKAEIFYYLSDYDQAIACLEELIKISPNCVDAHKLESEIFNEIISKSNEAIKNNPDN